MSLQTILFLDDDENRHRAFKSKMLALGFLQKYQLVYSYTAAHAITMLKKHDGEVEQAFLDHDLSEEDIMIIPGARSKVPTGMEVVNFIVGDMKTPPHKVIVHSMNGPAAEAMVSKLSKRVVAAQIPFHDLLYRLR